MKKTPKKTAKKAAKRACLACDERKDALNDETFVRALALDIVLAFRAPDHLCQRHKEMFGGMLVGIAADALGFKKKGP